MSQVMDLTSLTLSQSMHDMLDTAGWFSRSNLKGNCTTPLRMNTQD